MQIRRIRTMLWLATTCLLVVAVALLFSHMAVPPSIAQTPGTPTSRIDKTEGSPVDLQQLPVERAALQQVAAKDIRQRLFDPPIVAAKPLPPKPLPPVQLISTILREQGPAFAWVQDGQSTRKIKVGDTVGPENNPARITAIEPDRIVLQHEDAEVEVTQGAGAGGDRRR